MPGKPFLSIVIPAYNEAGNISHTLSEISEYVSGKDFIYEVIVVDDGSTDATVDEAERLKKEFDDLKIIKSIPNRGKGHVLRKGMLESKGEYIMFMDADSSVSVKALDDFLPLLKEDFDIYIASRRIPGAKVSMPRKRETLGKIYISLSRVTLNTRVNDINCGFKLFKHDTAKKIFSKQIMNDWSFDAEVLFIAGKCGYKIKEVPVEWVYKDTSKVRPIRDGINSFISLIKIRINELKGVYN